VPVFFEEGKARAPGFASYKDRKAVAAAPMKGVTR